MRGERSRTFPDQVRDTLDGDMGRAGQRRGSSNRPGSTPCEHGNAIIDARNPAARVEARVGIEPAYADLQSAA